MSLISKIQTLIDYAKFGMAQCILYNGSESYDLHFPRAITTYDSIKNGGWQYNARSITGYVKILDGANFATGNATTEIIDLPELVENRAYSMFNRMSVLKICKMPKIQKMGKYFISDCPKLEYLEMGVLTSMDTTSVKGDEALKEFVVGKGTRANLYLYHCPNLSKECLENIIDNLEDRTGLTSSTFYVGEENLAKISPEYITKLNQKHWTYQ